MAVLTWGKPKIYIKNLTGSGSWTEITIPIKQRTATLETEDGEKTEALDEGGETVDVRYAKSKYTFTFSLYKTAAADTKPITDADGLVTDNYGVRLLPEDNTLTGFELQKCNVSVRETWSSADGGLLVYTFTALKPTTGNMLIPYSGSSS